MAAANPSADRNLLFGILALQMDFIMRDQLVAAMHAWVLDKAKPLGTILVEQKALRPSQLAALETMIQAHLEAHANDPAQSLAALGAINSARDAIASIADADVQASLSQLAASGRGAGGEGRLSGATTISYGDQSSDGRFLILRPHARGGLGQVYVARDGELNRDVALKEILDDKADITEARTRFLLEAEITGGLEHPGIVPVYGLGHHADGRPFYAMRFIRGDSLKDAIRRFHSEPRTPVSGSATGGQATQPLTGVRGSFASLDFRRLLGRFVDVCNAIAYAHSRGVLHRDLKPGNVMLGNYGETLVVDWGLAKATISDQELVKPQGESSSLGGRRLTAGELPLLPKSASNVQETVAGTAIGTPAYMPPEQAAGRLDQLGPQSDVYSLGATLFSILFNRPPIQGDDSGEVLRKVQAGEIDFTVGQAASLPAAPGRQAGSLPPRALIAICKKAMALRPGDRYPSALALAADVEHWLADEPVTAFSEPLTARAGRWARKHRVLATSAAAVLVVATISLVIASALLGAKNRQLANAYAAEQQATREAKEAQEKAELEAATATAVKDFLRFDLLQLASARRQHREEQLGTLKEVAPDLRISELVLRAAERIEKKLTDQPLVEAEIRATLGWTLVEIGRDKEAVRQFERQREIYREKLGPDHPKTVGSMNNLAVSFDALGRHAEALKLREETFHLLKAKLGVYDPDTLGSMNNLALSYAAHGRHQQALELHEETLSLRKATLGPNHPDTLWSKHNLANSYEALGRQQDALKLRQEALRLRQAELGHDHPDTLASMSNLARSYFTLDRHHDALQMYMETLQRQKATLGPDHPDTLGCMSNLAISYAAVGNHPEALKLHEEALRLRRAKLGPEHPSTLWSLNNLAESYRMASQNAAAAVILKEGLGRRQARLKAQPGNSAEASLLAWTQGQLGQVEQDRFDFAAAVKAYQQSLDLFGKLDQAGVLTDSFFRGKMNFFRQQLAVCEKAEQAIRDLDFALKEPGPAAIPLLDVRVRYFLKEKQLATAVESAGKAKERAKAARQLYDAACLYALCAAAKDASTPAADAARFAWDHADEAMRLLTRAVLKGYNNAAHMMRDRDLEALRVREDFQKLAAQLEGAKKSD